MILGLDCSTKTCGFCVLDNQKNFVDIGYVDLSSYKDLYEKMTILSAELSKIIEQYKINKVLIEEPVVAFSSSTAHVISLLQRWNGFVCSYLYTHHKLKSISVRSGDARKSFGIKIPKGCKGKNTKIFIVDHLIAKNVIPYARWVRNRKGNFADTSFDMADAFVVAWSN